MKKYPEDAMKIYGEIVEHSARIERLLDLFQKEQERSYKRITELMNSMATEVTETETGIGSVGVTVRGAKTKAKTRNGRNEE